MSCIPFYWYKIIHSQCTASTTYWIHGCRRETICLYQMRGLVEMNSDSRVCESREMVGRSNVERTMGKGHL